nr:serine hydrolase domain-containing protein [uncultured Massilia sp.]
MQFLKLTGGVILLAVFLAPTSDAATPAETIDAELTRLFPANLPGAAVLVMKDGVTLLDKGYGLANIELQVPIQPGHVFYAASVSKQFTAAAIMKLVEDGKLTVQAPIRKFFPNVPASWNGITVEHLLHHTSGIANLYTDAGFREHAFEPHTPEQLLGQAIAMPLLGPPGKQFTYASVNYTLLAMIIEQVSGEKYDAYLASQFFMPLSMKKTVFIQNAGPIDGLVTPYEHGPKLAVRWDSSLMFGGGSFASTNADLARWTLALQSGNVLKPASVQAMNTALTLSDGSSVPYGYGIRPHMLAGQPYIRSSGDIQGFHAEVAYLPQSRVLVSILSNSEDTPKFGLLPAARHIAIIAAGLPLHPVMPKPVPDRVLQQRAGVYRHSNERYTFRAERGRLMMQEPGSATWEPLQPLSPTEFYYEANSDFRIRFSNSKGGHASSQWFEMDPLDDSTDPVFEKE